jgi:mRNA-degrading endonuclease YafQ of YafQ-DinJ toxin-antitoxin module
MSIFINSPVFVREYRKLTNKNPKLKQKIIKKIEFFAKNPKHSSLRIHKVYSPKVGEVLSLSIDGDLRILFRFKENNKIVFYRIGSHKEVY